MIEPREREKFRLIRYEYYHCGRNAMRFGNFFVAGILLGYAAETTLKAGLAEVLTPEERMKNGILQHNHDIVKVINECNKYGIYKDIAVSNDFLNYLNNNFQRYPSQMAKISEEAKKTNIVLCNSTDYVYYCDDFIIQLDCSLRRFTNDNATSMLYFALRTLETKYARDFLYENAFALRHYEEYEVDLNGLRLREDLKKEVIENYNKGYQYYWNGAIGDETIKRKIDEIISSYKCSDFHFQKWGDGSTIIV